MRGKPCSVEHCNTPAASRGWCAKHYQRWRRHGDPGHETAYTVERPTAYKECSVVDCSGFVKAKSLCDAHYQRWRRDGDPGGPLVISARESDATERVCVTCELTKPADEFLRDPRYPDRLLSTCRACRTRANLSKMRLHRYGLTVDEYDSMLASQGGGCAVCGSTIRLCVDHCHDTGKVRGILCNECNVALGRLGDDPSRIRRLADYVSV